MLHLIIFMTDYVVNGMRTDQSAKRYQDGMGKFTDSGGNSISRYIAVVN